jgi:hypothetical protein
MDGVLRLTLIVIQSQRESLRLCAFLETIRIREFRWLCCHPFADDAWLTSSKENDHWINM